MVVVRSIIISRLTVAGTEARNSGSSAWTRSTTSMMLALGWRLMISITAGLPLATP